MGLVQIKLQFTGQVLLADPAGSGSTAPGAINHTYGHLQGLLQPVGKIETDSGEIGRILRVFFSPKAGI